MNMDGPPFQGRTPDCGVAAKCDEFPRLDERLHFGSGIVDGDKPQSLAVKAENARPLSCTQSDSIRGQGFEDRFEIERGSSNHLEQLTGGCLLLECGPQLAVSRLYLFE
jgi:hypothetical protein